MKNSHVEFYSKAKYYDIAFSFKNVVEENQTLIDIFLKQCGRLPDSFLDIAAGPALNALDMRRRGLKAIALDFSAEMVAYGLEKARLQKLELDYLQKDMRHFALQRPVDLAAIFMDSTSYLLTNADVIDHLRSVAKSLAIGGLYILEMSHPRDVFGVAKSASTEWSQAQDGIEVTVQWGQDGDYFDPIRQTTLTTAKLKYNSPFESGEITEQCQQRCFTFNEIALLVTASGCFEMVDVLGSLKPGVPFSNDSTSWRMIPILKKV